MMKGVERKDEATMVYALMRETKPALLEQFLALKHLDLRALLKDPAPVTINDEHSCDYR